MALMLERHDAWSMSQLEFGAGQKVRPPGLLKITRPMEAVKPRRSLEEDLAIVAGVLKSS